MIDAGDNQGATYGQPHTNGVPPAPRVSGEGRKGEIDMGAAGMAFEELAIAAWENEGGRECGNHFHIKPPVETPAEPAGRAPSGLTAIHDARLERRSVLEGWSTQSQRFPTRVPLKELESQIEQKEGNETLVERLVLDVADGLKTGSERFRGICARTAVVMERMNQADDHHGEGTKVLHEHSGTVELTTEQRRKRLVEILDGLRERKRTAGNRSAANGLDVSLGIGGLDESGPLRSDGEQGSMDDGPAPEGAGSGGYGSDPWGGL